jgi:hypothetical protein
MQCITQRVATQLVDPDPNILNRLRAFTRDFIHKNFDPLKPDELMDFYEWIAVAPYPNPRKRELIKVYEELKGQYPSLKQSSRVNCFIKVQSDPLNHDNKLGYTPYKAGRAIMSRSDYAKVTMGPAIHSIEEKVYSIMKPDGHPYFIKHVPVPLRYHEVNSLCSAGSHYIITDYTSFEASFHPAVLRAVECQLYSYMLAEDPVLANWIQTTLSGKNVLRFRNGTKVTIEGRRMSGDMCTSLGNGFTNLMLMLFATREQSILCNGFVEGDDGVFAVSKVPDTSVLESLGFRVKMAEVDHPGLGGFCGVVAADNGNIKDPVKFLQTFGWTHSCLSGGPRVMHSLLRAKALSGIYELPNCPIIRVLCDRALELTTGVEPRFDDFNSYSKPPPRTTPPPYEPTPATRDLFAELFGVSVQTQLVVEARLRTAVELSDAGIAESLSINPEYDFNWSRFVSP